MKLPNYQRTLEILCPTCGSTQFENSGDESEAALLKCASCGREISRDELIRENGENIDAHAKEMGQQALDEAAKQLKKSLADAFRNSKFIKIR